MHRFVDRARCRDVWPRNLLRCGVRRCPCTGHCTRLTRHGVKQSQRSRREPDCSIWGPDPSHQFPSLPGRAVSSPAPLPRLPSPLQPSPPLHGTPGTNRSTPRHPCGPPLARADIWQPSTSSAPSAQVHARDLLVRPPRRSFPPFAGAVWKTSPLAALDLPPVAHWRVTLSLMRRGAPR